MASDARRKAEEALAKLSLAWTRGEIRSAYRDVANALRDILAEVEPAPAAPDELREALRHCARELQYIREAGRCDQGSLHVSGEGQACVVLAESLLGPMREWAEEPNASMSATLAAKREDR